MLLNLIKHGRSDFDKIDLYLKDPLKSKYQLLVNKREKIEIIQEKTQRHLLIIHKQLIMSMKT